MNDKRCKGCGGAMEGRRLRNIYCGQACKDAAIDRASEELRALRTRVCIQCGASFTAKKSQLDSGNGKYCSVRCASGHLTTPGNLARAAEARKASVAINGTAHKKGAAHPSWKGGREAVRERQREKWRSEGGKERLRKYRAENPEKVREFRQRRSGKKIGRLPPGTVKKIGTRQKWMCVVCRRSIKDAYHVDHITPIARGGDHSPLNIQLLCPTCNVRKSAKDPIDFMQSRGYLL
ncbi:HNH endonuclease [Acidovorax sp. RAC01]|uniref:HNH endonuclease n=1 Tax=Acidovorax sp. RAC01 TaxID=1842533 RepID=UPI00085687CE|nr:HNH endonuclease [Acidovorax sp. RAC01]AOG22403.1 HNH endonuclease family protein [Acidovorax sp. RAC01]AOG22925.1 HNH endonuclease family protein [Acidovorax sp. RAC01]